MRNEYREYGNRDVLKEVEEGIMKLEEEGKRLDRLSRERMSYTESVLTKAYGLDNSRLKKFRLTWLLMKDEVVEAESLKHLMVEIENKLLHIKRDTLGEYFHKDIVIRNFADTQILAYRPYFSDKNDRAIDDVYKRLGKGNYCDTVLTMKDGFYGRWFMPDNRTKKVAYSNKDSIEENKTDFFKFRLTWGQRKDVIVEYDRLSSLMQVIDDTLYDRQRGVLILGRSTDSDIEIRNFADTKTLAVREYYKNGDNSAKSDMNLKRGHYEGEAIDVESGFYGRWFVFDNAEYLKMSKTLKDIPSFMNANPLLLVDKAAIIIEFLEKQIEEVDVFMSGCSESLQSEVKEEAERTKFYLRQLIEKATKE